MYSINSFQIKGRKGNPRVIQRDVLKNKPFLPSILTNFIVPPDSAVDDFDKNEIKRFMIDVVKYDRRNAILTLKTNSCDTPLHIALKNRSPFSIIKNVFNNNSLYIMNKEGDYPVTIAIKNRYDIKIVRMLLIDLPDTYPLYLLALNAYGDEVTADDLTVRSRLFFPNYNIDIRINDEDTFYKDEYRLHFGYMNRTPLHNALLCGNYNYNFITSFITNESLVVRDDYGDFPIHIALKNGHFLNVISKLSTKSTLNAQDINGDTPLHLAISLGLSIETVISLITQNVLTMQNNDGNTPLHLALIKGYGPFVIKALSYVRDVLLIKNNKLESPLRLAVSFNHPNEVINLLSSIT